MKQRMVGNSGTMVFQILLTCLVFCFVSGQSPPVPGDASWVGTFKFATNSSVRYGVLPQSLLNQEWKSLATSFTVEFWVKPSSFPSDPDGKWNDAYRLRGETQFLPLLTRHPGMGHTNQWAHFLTQLTRTPNGMALVVWAGCGCTQEPKIVNGRQFDLTNCGYGYLLNSDNPKISANGKSPFFVPTERWTHVAFSFDGDNSDLSKSRMAKLYINGELLYTNQWADPANVGEIYNKSVCVDKPMQWFRDFGHTNDIRLAFLDNQDFNTGRIVNNLDRAFNIYGFNGSLDEIRIWRGPRTDKQIKDNYDLALTNKDLDEDSLVSYLKFNDGPQGNILYGANFGDASGSGLTGYVVTNDNSDFSFWTNSRGEKQLGLPINTKLTIPGVLPTTPMPIAVQFKLPGSSLEPTTPTVAPVLATSFQPFNISIYSLSPLLMKGINSGDIKLTVGGSNLTTGMILTPDQSVQLSAKCRDAICSNLVQSNGSFPFREFAITYQSIPRSNLLASIFLEFVPDCDGVYDACGVCNGDNRTCQCIFYHDFKNVRMSYLLLTFMIDFLIDKVSSTSQILDETIDKVTAKLQPLGSPNSNNGFPTLVGGGGAQAGTPLVPMAGPQATLLMKFFNGCLSPYCQTISKLAKVVMTL